MNQYEFMRAHTTEFDLSEMCTALALSRSGYYRWVNAKPSLRDQADGVIEKHIESVYGRAT